MRPEPTDRKPFKTIILTDPEDGATYFTNVYAEPDQPILTMCQVYRKDQKGGSGSAVLWRMIPENMREAIASAVFPRACNHTWTQ